jgi:F-type H+-transporting ATPase subunit c
VSAPAHTNDLCTNDLSARERPEKGHAGMEGTLNLVGYGLSAIGPGIAVGLIFAAYINGVARQPEARGILQPIAFLGFALAEALALFGLVLAFVL